ncbi:hypothetical protein CPH97_27925 [Klebsiella pneumoniae subsp. pneumoniae]|nr:hypothetical protein [Klebsiella pneumoniae subsp. pneumoniae]
MKMPAFEWVHVQLHQQKGMISLSPPTICNSAKYGYRSLKYQVFDKLECLDQGQIVDNKRLGAVLKLAQSKMDELERDGKRDRSKKMPKRRAQARVQEQLRAINPVLVNPDEFRASLKR